MTTPEEKILEENKLKLEEQRIQYEALRKDFDKLEKTDPKWMGIDLADKEYWIYGHGWKINQISKATKTQLVELFTRHDDLVAKHAELDPVKDAVERIRVANEQSNAREEIENVGIPLMLLEMNGKPFNEKKWFGDNTIPAAAWWDCATDVFLFLRESGSKDDTLLSMMRRNSA